MYLKKNNNYYIFYSKLVYFLGLKKKVFFNYRHLCMPLFFVQYDTLSGVVTIIPLSFITLLLVHSLIMLVTYSVIFTIVKAPNIIDFSPFCNMALFLNIFLLSLITGTQLFWAALLIVRIHSFFHFNEQVTLLRKLYTAFCIVGLALLTVSGSFFFGALSFYIYQAKLFLLFCLLGEYILNNISSIKR
jgi:hypothetical protein